MIRQDPKYNNQDLRFISQSFLQTEEPRRFAYRVVPDDGLERIHHSSTRSPILYPRGSGADDERVINMEIIQIPII